MDWKCENYEVKDRTSSDKVY